MAKKAEIPIRAEFETYQLMAEDATLRDYFAAKAMQGMMAAQASGDPVYPCGHAAIAQEAYVFADAMLEERKK